MVARSLCHVRPAVYAHGVAQLEHHVPHDPPAGGDVEAAVRTEAGATHPLTVASQRGGGHGDRAGGDASDEDVGPCHLVLGVRVGFKV